MHYCKWFIVRWWGLDSDSPEGSGPQAYKMAVAEYWTTVINTYNAYNLNCFEMWNSNSFGIFFTNTPQSCYGYSSYIFIHWTFIYQMSPSLYLFFYISPYTCFQLQLPVFYSPPQVSMDSSWILHNLLKSPNNPFKDLMESSWSPWGLHPKSTDLIESPLILSGLW